MVVRLMRVLAGLLLVMSGALLYAASWQRWAGACRENQSSKACLRREDHLYDFDPPLGPWEPVGDAAVLGGISMLVLAAVFVLLPWAMTGRRPGAVTAVVLAVGVLVQMVVGAATLRSGLTGTLVEPLFVDVILLVWVFVPLGLLIGFATASRGWTLATAGALVAASPLVAGFTYAIGAYDSRPWYEAISAVFLAAAGVCVLAAAASDRKARTSADADAAVPGPAPGASAPS